MDTINKSTSTPNYYGGNNNNPEQGNSKRLLTIAAIAIALLLGTNIYLLLSKNKIANAHTQIVKDLDTKAAALQELETQYADITAQLNQERTTNAELSTKIDEQLAQLGEQKNRIASLIKDGGNLKAARAEMASMKAQTEQYLAEIQTLKAQVGQLTDENVQLNTKATELATNLTDTRTKLDEETTAKAALISEKSQLENVNKGLSKKVDIASAVKVSGVTVTPVVVKSSGKEKSRSKAKNVDKLNICFNTEANDVVESGNEVFYIRVVDPTGAPLAIESLGSGVAENKKSQSDFRYTTKAEVNYANAVTNVCGVWNPGADFMKGKYSVEIFNKGYMIGTGEFSLK